MIGSPIVSLGEGAVALAWFSTKCVHFVPHFQSASDGTGTRDSLNLHALADARKGRCPPSPHSISQSRAISCPPLQRGPLDQLRLQLHFWCAAQH
ncbi:hypothetical protein PILCRDRAFT_810547, partial [Piloderma croceum F 1598]